MAQASITITDDDNGQVTVAADFGTEIVQASMAHQMVEVLLRSVLSNSKNFTKLEDTAPENDMEPSRIIVPGQESTH